jgi:hypothetical protein
MRQKEGLTVRELIEKLEEIVENSPEAENMKVGFTYDYGDYSHTSVVKMVTAADDYTVCWSEYSYCRGFVLNQ